MEKRRWLSRLAATAAAAATLLTGGLVASTALAADSGLAHSKTIAPEGDGYRISLTANNHQWSLTKPADVLVLVDHSGSMNFGMNEDVNASDPSQSRWHYLSEDLKRLADTLSNGTNRLGGVTFHSKARALSYGGSAFTTDGKTWLDSVQFDGAGGSTNWEDAFVKADSVLGEMNPDHDKYVVFVTDGEPNGRVGDNGETAFDDYFGPDLEKTKKSKYFTEAVDEAKLMFSKHKDVKLLSVGEGAEVPALKLFQQQVTGSENGFYDGTDPSSLQNAFTDIIVSTVSPLVINDVLSENADYAGDVKVTDGNGDPVPSSQYSAEYDADSRSFTVTFNSGFKPKDGQTYTASFKVKPSQKAYDALAAVDGKYPTVGDPATGATSAGKPGLYTNDKATVTYNNQGTPTTLEYPKPVEQVALTSLTVNRTGDCAGDVTVHLWKDGKDTGLSASLGKNGKHTFANLAPGHKYEAKADAVKGGSCTVPTTTPPSYEPKPGDKPGTITVDTDQEKANLAYDKNAQQATGSTKGYDGKGGDTPTIAANGFTNEGYTFQGWNTQADGKGKTYVKGDKLTLPAGTTVLYAQWKRIPGTLTWVKTDKDSGEVLAGSEWILTPKGGQPTTVTDNGDLDQADADGAFKLTGLDWGEYELMETKAPEGHDPISEPIAVTIDAKHTTVNIGDVGNAKTPAKVTYDPNGGEGDTPGYDGHVGDTPEASENKFTNKDECKEFAGWNTQADGKGKAYAKGDRIDPLTGDVTLYAQWKAKDGCPAAPAALQELGKTGAGIAPIAIGMAAATLLGACLTILRRQRRARHA